MQPLSAFPADIARGISCVFTDIDGTLTNEGRLPANAYAALEALHKAGIQVAPITGRPAGWCDMIARMWPIAGVVGENGAFYFSYDEASKKMLRVYEIDAATRTTNQQKLAHIQARVLAEVQGCAVSADQPYREADLAIDFCEDVPPLPEASVQRIVDIFEEEGAVAKVSSIHVNGWFGSYDKLSMSRRFAAERLGVGIAADRNRIVFCGDSPNDSPMFAYFPYACGVANVADFSGKMAANPAYIAPSRGGDGFVEIAEMLLRSRS